MLLRGWGERLELACCEGPLQEEMLIYALVWDAHPLLLGSREQGKGMIEQRLGTLPFDLVLDRLLNKANPLKHIGDIIYASLLDLQLYGGIIQVDFFALTVLYEVNELLGKLAQRVIDARSR